MSAFLFYGSLLMLFFILRLFPDEIYAPLTRISIIATFSLFYIGLLSTKEYKANNDLDKMVYYIIIILMAIFMNGLLKIVLDSSSTYILPILINKYDFIYHGVYSTVIYLMIYTTSIFYTFGKSKNFIVALIIGLSLGSSAVFLTTITGLKEININYDNSLEIIEKDFVVKKWIDSSRRGKHYYLRLSNLGDLHVNRSFYNRFTKHSYVNTYQKSGYLGAKWVYKIKSVEEGK